MHRHKIYFEMLIVMALLATFSLLVKVGVDPDWGNTTLAMSTFVFAIVLAFSTANRKQRIDSIRTLLRQNDALYINIFELSKAFTKKDSEKIVSKIDKLLTSQIDYNIVDIENTTTGYTELLGEVRKLKIAEEGQSDIKASLLDYCGQLISNQKEIIYWVTDRMRRIEWIVLIILGAVIAFVLTAMSPDSSLLYDLIVALITTSVYALLVVVRELNNLRWQEKAWVWNPLISTFLELNLLPYFPEDIFEARSIKISDLKRMNAYRVAHYAHPYPNFDNKEVEIIKPEK